MISQEEISRILEAGRIGAEARELGASLVKPGASAREICDEVESLIIRRGAKPAFPCNFSINEVAAHYSPGIDDDVKVPDKAVVKVDVGASVDGYLSDTAVTVAIGSESFQQLALAAKSALDKVAEVMKPDIRVYDIGKTIESVIKSMGFKPVRNLTGHTIERYTLHAGLSVPNYAERTLFYHRLRPGTQVAVEPFATSGRGLVVDGPKAYIYSATGNRPQRISETARQLLEYILSHYSTLPFAKRWLYPEWKREEIEAGLAELVKARALVEYPVLIEASRAPVSQFEHTFVITHDGVIVATKL
ncbi:Methionine aminopeptidase [Acidilobus saccharovorans 345-15]|uniref:Methionine aminopeptidase n=1 Tax=Acidilobus saccharovorans (strain DSM 16705 / JCM 18335 / VKM B-2471 / 345-15) TaxID=666510 RepID=D9Q0L1_ACIS3|nr:type II methionyl aminopeptidase [Acidilobus saccharovorans]ADL18849.1 Methionine aminopeptidase [Acidilobus saccharovorans 345-15]